MNRRSFLLTGSSLTAAALARPYVARAAVREIVVAEPVHGIGYLPLYLAMAKGYFAEADISAR